MYLMKKASGQFQFTQLRPDDWTDLEGYIVTNVTWSQAPFLSQEQREQMFIDHTYAP